MAPPVSGLRPLRALRIAVLKVPKPTRVTASPFFNDFVMLASVVATIFDASRFETLVSRTILAIRSCLFICAFGAFKTSNRKARTARNPQTGAMIKIPKRKAVRFVAGKALKSAVN